VLLLLLQAAEKDELSSRAKGDVVMSLLPLVDNFELARTQVKAETEAEQKINNSYQVGGGSESERRLASMACLAAAVCLRHACMRVDTSDAAATAVIARVRGHTQTAATAA
jgi:hypothetical protein